MSITISEQTTRVIVTGADPLTLKIATPGPQGSPGADGTDGADGADGAGVPAGGTTGQYLGKASDADGDTTWLDLPEGGGGGGVLGVMYTYETAPTTPAVNSPASDWKTIPYNTTGGNTLGAALEPDGTISGVPAGVYVLRASQAIRWGVGTCKLAVWNMTTGVRIKQGQWAELYEVAGYGGQDTLNLLCTFTLATTSTIAVRIWAEYNYSAGLGAARGYYESPPVDNNHGTVVLQKIA